MLFRRLKRRRRNSDAAGMRKLQFLIVLIVSAVFLNVPALAETEDYVVGAEQFIRDIGAADQKQRS